ncbi:hypothetical protein UFOVP1649_26 [uncultured Caudovirales phage]|uniref:Uncharacterized protein n=1 Tax=uncultured Caudovirales phage TaxID=2100421 RepID=A0A6J5T2W4_9CAUD|nr:hypothetical protein UFOVP1649_26 [uncultured Caudovirales phage]
MARKAQITIYTAFKDQGFKKAEKGLKNLRFQANGLNSSLAKLGLGVGVAQFARTSIKAAVEMEQANSRLAVSLNNIGKGSMVGSASIRTSEKAMMSLGFEGTQTALALSTLVTATGSLDKAQGMLAASADLARYNNIDLATSARILAKASGGNAKAFKELNITMDKSLPPAKALEKAMGMLNAKIGGQAAAYVKTYSGQLAILEAKFQDVQEQVGYKLLPVLIKLGDFLINTGIPRLESFFKILTDNKNTLVPIAAGLLTVATAIKAIGTAAAFANIAALPLLAALAPFIAAAAAIAGVTAAVAMSPSGTPKGAPIGVGTPMGRGSAAIALQQQNNAKKAAAVTPAAKTGLDPFRNFDRQAYQTQKDLLATQKASLAQTKKDAAQKLADQRKIDAEKKLAAQFDVNQIALANALKLNLTEKEKAAIEGLIALQDDGYKTEAQRMLDQEAALRKLITLRTDLASIPFYSPTLAGQEKQVSAPIGVPVSATQTAVQEAIAKQTEQMNAGALAKALQTDAFTPAPAKTGAIAPSFSFSTDPSQQGIMTAQQSAMQGLVVNINAPMVTPEVVDQISSALNNKLKAGGVWYQNAAIG